MLGDVTGPRHDQASKQLVHKLAVSSSEACYCERTVVCFTCPGVYCYCMKMCRVLTAACGQVLRTAFSTPAVSQACVG